MRGPRIPARVLKVEKQKVMQFVFLKIHKKEGTLIPVINIYRAFVDWHRKEFHEDPVVNVNGFGRLLPKNLRAGSHHMPSLGQTVRAVRGYEVA